MNNLNSLNETSLWSEDLQDGVNTQIAIELNNFMTYQAWSAVFAHASISYPVIAKFFKQEADEELKHARSFMDYQNMRGGKVKITTSPSLNDLDYGARLLYDSPRPILEAYKMALDLEKYTYSKLLNLHVIAGERDPQFSDFIEEMLKEQLETQQKLNFKIIQLSRADSSVVDYIHGTSDTLE